MMTRSTFPELLVAWLLCLSFSGSLVIAWRRTSNDLYSSSRLYYKNPRNVPSDLCPRDEAQAQLQGRTCLRKCTSDEDCKSKRKKCMCDGACGLSCVKPERECLDPEPPAELGEVQANGKMFGSKATYSCPDGFKVIGLEVRICQADGTWNGSPPTCQKNTFCTEPPIIEHARHNGPLDQKTFDLDFSLQYQCLPGYITKGFARTKCFLYNGTAKWFGPDITCEAKSCGDPQDILNGRSEGECHHVGCEITYVCQPGFELVGRKKYNCQADGTWVPKDLPTCVPVQCSIPENPGNGKALFNSLSFNSVVTYECKYGYMLVGEGTRRCGPNKRWSGVEPQCKEINCGSPGILPNGLLDGSRMTLHAVVIFKCMPGMTFEGPSDRSVCQSDGSWSLPSMPKCLEINCGHPGHVWNGWIDEHYGTGLGASIIFRCYDGMTLEGPSSSLCTIEGKWNNPNPSCLAPCKVPIIPFGNVTFKEETESPGTNETISVNITMLRPGTTISHGKAIGVECEKHYEASHVVSPPVCNNGSWSNAPKCQPARCKAIPKAPRHGMVIAPKTEHGMKARFKCRDGYDLVGQNLTVCEYGQWAGETPFCNQTFCKFPGSIPNGRVLLVGNMGLYDYRNYVTKVANNRQIMFDCEKGYVLADGPQGKTCIRGEWSPKAETPRCIASQHPNFRWIRRRRAIKGGGTSNVVKSKITGGRGSTKIKNRKKKKPTGDGEEEEEEYEEDISVCPPLDDPYLEIEILQAGDDVNQTFSSGAVVKVKCGHGYAVNLLNDTIICKDGSRWKPKIPQCSPMPCNTPYIVHGTLYEGSKALVFQDAIKHSKAIELRCSKGYALKGDKKFTCWHGELDTEDLAECLPAPCKLPSLTYGTYVKGYRSGMHVAHGTEVDFTCDGDFRKLNPGSSNCFLGEFKPSKPSCFHPSNLPHGNSSNEYSFDGSDKKKKDIAYPVIKRACGSPPMEKGAIAYVEGRPVDYSNEFSFPDSTDIQYRCGKPSTVNPKERTKVKKWKVICNDGMWSNSNGSCDGETLDSSVNELLDLINGSCKYKSQDKNVATFYNDHQLGPDPVEFPSGSVLISRCVDIGKFRLKGAVKRKCISGQWIGITPKCEGLSQQNDYQLGRPPTILFRYVNGSIIQSNDGRLLIYEGTTLHMECLWIRKFGSPKWETSNKHREYQEGWATDPLRNADLEYRLTIDNAQPEDSGIYRCVTPARYAHEVNIEVIRLQCPDLPEHSELIYSTTSNQLGTVVNFTCKGGNSVVGPETIKCLPSGNWSSPPPTCQSVQCRDISLLPAMGPIATFRNGSLKKNETAPPKVKVLSLDVGGKAIFTCPQGFVTEVSDAVCKGNGEWSTPVPHCKEVECPAPSPPDNGFVAGKAPYKAGDLAQFECNTGFMMEGQPIIACQDNGKWSRASGIKCVVSCPYPGTTIGGSISSVKFYYAIGETVTFDCIDDYELQGTRMLHCLKNGKWSNSVPQCMPQSKDDPNRLTSTDPKNKTTK